MNRFALDLTERTGVGFADAEQGQKTGGGFL